MTVGHDKITLLGTLAGGVANWSASFGTPPSGGSTYGVARDLALAAVTHFDHALDVGGMLDHWTAATKFIGAKCSKYDDANHLLVSAEVLLDTPTPGTALGACLPPEVAICCSLRSDTPGPRGRGRMYLPSSRTADLTTVGAVDPSYVDVVVATMGQFFDDWDADPSTGVASVVSQRGSEVSPVTSIRVGNVFDSQRRRRWSIPEGYAARTIITG